MSAQRNESVRIDLSASDLHDGADGREVALPSLRILTAPHPVVAAEHVAPPRPRLDIPAPVRFVDVGAPIVLAALVLKATADPLLALLGLVAWGGLVLLGLLAWAGPSGAAARTMQRFGREAEVVGFVHVWSLCAVMVIVAVLGLAFGMGWQASSITGRAFAAMLLSWPAIAYLVAVRGLWRERRRVGIHALVTASPWLATGGLLATAGSIDAQILFVDIAAGCWLAAALAFGLELGRARIGAPRPTTIRAVLAESRGLLAPAFAALPPRSEKT